MDKIQFSLLSFLAYFFCNIVSASLLRSILMNSRYFDLFSCECGEFGVKNC